MTQRYHISKSYYIAAIIVIVTTIFFTVASSYHINYLTFRPTNTNLCRIIKRRLSKSNNNSFRTSLGTRWIMADSRSTSSSTAYPLTTQMKSCTSLGATVPLSFQSYIAQVKGTVLTNNKEQNYNIIMGNEAGDADSIVSALALSYVKSLPTTTIKQHSKNDYYSPIPVVSIMREDMKLRRDVINLLTMVGIDIDQDLLYLNDSILQSTILGSGDDVDVVTDLAGTQAREKEKKKKKNQIQITLVDHNKLRSDLWHLQDAVVEILDHHQDEGYHTSTVSKRIVAFQDQYPLVGSTCTLITEYLMKYYEEANTNTNNSRVVVDPSIGLVLLGVIVLDTMNMCEKAAKGTPRDEAAIGFLLRRTDWNLLLTATQTNDMLMSVLQKKDIFVTTTVDTATKLSSGDMPTTLLPNRARLYEYLHDSKIDKSFWEDMSARDALRIDYKRFEAAVATGNKKSFGLSSVLLPIATIVTKDNFFKSAIRFMQEETNNVDLLGVLSFVISNNDEQPQRELLLIGSNKELLTGMAEYLVRDPSASFLEMNKIDEGSAVHDDDDDDGWEYIKFSQANVKGSRKQVAPVILNYFTR